MNAIRLHSRSSAWALGLLALAAALPTGADAQDKDHNAYQMRHKVKERFKEDNPDKNGRWETLTSRMPINPIHIAMMYTGRVLIIAGSGNDPDNKNYQAAVWDPKTRVVKTFKTSWDMFCNGMVILPDGKPFVLGGTKHYDSPSTNFKGLPKTATFDPGTETFADAPEMGNDQGRWYPSGVVLGNGTVMVSSGNNIDGTTNKSVQIWTGTKWKLGGTAYPRIENYPRQHLLPDGKVFVSGPNTNSQMYDPPRGTFAPVANTLNPGRRIFGTSVLLPLTPENGFEPQVMVMGGFEPDKPRDNKTGVATTELIDLSLKAPKWVLGPPMVRARTQMNATILPNGLVLTSGGSVKDEQGPTAVKEAQVYDPIRKSFRSASLMEFPRLYHSSTMLLPDATVVALGGNPERKVYQSEIEVYSPAYLFKADKSLAVRPTITGVAPGKLHYGKQFIVTTPDAKSIKSVVLIRPGAVTHAFDMEQRLVGLKFSLVGGVLQVDAPANGNLAPPGYYMLFILDGKGVPSVAQFVNLSLRD
jgi:hypothetical protein